MFKVFKRNSNVVIKPKSFVFKNLQWNDMVQVVTDGVRLCCCLDHALGLGLEPLQHHLEDEFITDVSIVVPKTLAGYRLYAFQQTEITQACKAISKLPAVKDIGARVYAHARYLAVWCNGRQIVSDRNLNHFYSNVTSSEMEATRYS